MQEGDTERLYPSTLKWSLKVAFLIVFLKIIDITARKEAISVDRQSNGGWASANLSPVNSHPGISTVNL